MPPSGWVELKNIKINNKSSYLQLKVKLLFMPTQFSITVSLFMVCIASNASDASILLVSSVTHGNSCPYIWHRQYPSEIISSFSSIIPLAADSEQYSGVPNAACPNLVLPFSFAMFKSKTRFQLHWLRSRENPSEQIFAYQTDKLRHLCGPYWRAAHLVRWHLSHEYIPAARSGNRAPNIEKHFIGIDLIQKYFVLPLERRS